MLFDLFVDAPHREGIVSIHDEVTAIEEMITGSCIEFGRMGVRLSPAGSPPYSESAYFASNVLSSIKTYNKKIDFIKTNLPIYIMNMWDGKRGFVENIRQDFEPHTMYYCVSSLKMLNAWSDDLNDMARGLVTDYVKYASRKNLLENLDMANIFWISCLVNWTNCDEIVRSIMHQELLGFLNKNKCFITMRREGIMPTVPSIGMGVLASRAVGRLIENSIMREFVQSCRIKNSFKEVPNGVETWSAFKWGSILSKIFGFERSHNYPSVLHRSTLWELHVICIARQAITYQGSCQGSYNK